MSSMRNPGLLAWLHLMRVFQKMQYHSMGHLHKYKVTPAQFEVLSRLWPGVPFDPFAPEAERLQQVALLRHSLGRRAG